MTTFALIPQTRDKVKIPVAAAGGIGDGRGVAAALILGADGVQIGTRFICTQECPVHINAKRAILRAKAEDTLVTGNITGMPVRALKNKFTEEYAAMEDIKNLPWRWHFSVPARCIRHLLMAMQRRDRLWQVRSAE
jgi:enoyl-[acyl-carrier protein] reductase II